MVVSAVEKSGDERGRMGDPCWGSAWEFSLEHTQQVWPSTGPGQQKVPRKEFPPTFLYLKILITEGLNFTLFIHKQADSWRLNRGEWYKKTTPRLGSYFGVVGGHYLPN